VDPPPLPPLPVHRAQDAGRVGPVHAPRAQAPSRSHRACGVPLGRPLAHARTQPPSASLPSRAGLHRPPQSSPRRRTSLPSVTGIFLWPALQFLSSSSRAPPRLLEPRHAAAGMLGQATTGHRRSQQAPRAPPPPPAATGARRPHLEPGFLLKSTWVSIPSLPSPSTGQVWCSPAGTSAVGDALSTRGQHCDDLLLSREIFVNQGPPRNFEKILQGPPANVLLGFQLQLRKIIRNRKKIRKCKSNFVGFLVKKPTFSRKHV
jgi:hypothetical protein